MALKQIFARATSLTAVQHVMVGTKPGQIPLGVGLYGGLCNPIEHSRSADSQNFTRLLTRSCFLAYGSGLRRVGRPMASSLLSRQVAFVSSKSRPRTQETPPARDQKLAPSKPAVEAAQEALPHNEEIHSSKLETAAGERVLQHDEKIGPGKIESRVAEENVSSKGGAEVGALEPSQTNPDISAMSSPQEQTAETIGPQVDAFQMKHNLVKFYTKILDHHTGKGNFLTDKEFKFATKDLNDHQEEISKGIKKERLVTTREMLHRIQIILKADTAGACEISKENRIGLEEEQKQFKKMRRDETRRWLLEMLGINLVINAFIWLF